MSHVTYHVSHVRCHVFGVRCHLSHVFFSSSSFEQIGGVHWKEQQPLGPFLLLARHKLENFVKSFVKHFVESFLENQCLDGVQGPANTVPVIRAMAGDRRQET